MSTARGHEEGRELKMILPDGWAATIHLETSYLSLILL